MPLRKARGKPQIFTDEQLTALRRAADQLAKLRGFESQQGLADVLEITQQSAGDFWKRNGGISWGPATVLVQELGFSGVDEFFFKEGVMSMREAIKRKPRGPIAGDERDDAAKIALHLGVDPAVIMTVNERYKGAVHIAAWYVERYMDEQKAIDPDRLSKADRLLRESSSQRPSIRNPEDMPKRRSS